MLVRVFKQGAAVNGSPEHIVINPIGSLLVADITSPEEYRAYCVPCIPDQAVLGHLIGIAEIREASLFNILADAKDGSKEEVRVGHLNYLRQVINDQVCLGEPTRSQMPVGPDQQLFRPGVST